MKLWKKNIWKNIILIVFGIIILLPFFWMFTTSVSDPLKIFSEKLRFFPEEWRWESYREAVSKVPFFLFMWNSFKIAFLVSLGQIITSFFAGYAFARLKFPMRNLIFYIVLGTLMIPGQVTLIPLYSIMAKFNLINTHWSLIIPGLASPFGIFLMRQYFLVFPTELEDAAKIDGCNVPKFLIHVALPSSKSILATLGVLAFIGSWGNFIGPLVFLTDLDKATVPLGLYRFMGSYSTSWPELMAATAISIIPLIVMYIIAQRYIIEAYSFAGVRK